MKKLKLSKKNRSLIIKLIKKTYSIYKKNSQQKTCLDVRRLFKGMNDIN